MLLVLNSSSSMEEFEEDRANDSDGDGKDEDADSATEFQRKDEECWSRMYALARASSKHLAPSLATCGLGGNQIWDDDQD